MKTNKNIKKYTLFLKIFRCFLSLSLFSFLYLLFGIHILSTPAEEPKKPAHGDPDYVIEELDDLCRQEFKEVFRSLENMEKDLNEREQQLKAKEMLINELESQLSEQQNALQNIKFKLEDFLNKRKSKKASYQRLTKFYESMNSENAAQTLIELHKLDHIAALEILSGLQNRKSGEIMNFIGETDPQFAAELMSQLTKKLNWGNEE